MRGLFVLSLEFVVPDHTVFPSDDFSHGIREIGTLSQREVIFDDVGLAVGAYDDQGAWVGSYGLVRRRNK